MRQDCVVVYRRLESIFTSCDRTVFVVYRRLESIFTSCDRTVLLYIEDWSLYLPHVTGLCCCI